MSDRPHHTPRLAVGVPLALALVWGIEGLASGGLAPVIVSALVATLVGAPLAARLWRLAGRDDPALEALAVSGRVLATVIAAGVMARVIPADAAGLALGLGLLGLGAVLARLRSGLAVVLAVVALLGAGAQSVHAPWSLLQPGWDAWKDWLPLALGSGLLLPGAGLGWWVRGRPAVPGFRRGPWLTTAIALGVLLGVSLVWAAQFEASSGTVLRGVGPLPFLLAGAVAIGWGDREEPPTLSDVLVLGLTYLWLQSPLAPEPAVFWPLLLSLPAVLAALLLAARSTGARRLTALVAPALVAITWTIAWPGFGSSALAAAAATAPLLLVLWTGGTRLAVGRP